MDDNKEQKSTVYIHGPFATLKTVSEASSLSADFHTSNFLSSQSNTRGSSLSVRELRNMAPKSAGSLRTSLTSIDDIYQEEKNATESRNLPIDNVALDTFFSSQELQQDYPYLSRQLNSSHPSRNERLTNERGELSNSRSHDRLHSSESSKGYGFTVEKSSVAGHMLTGIQLSDNDVDFGALCSGISYEYTLTVRNHCKKSVRVRITHAGIEARQSCPRAQMSVSFKSQVIAPGLSIPFHIVVVSLEAGVVTGLVSLSGEDGSDATFRFRGLSLEPSDFAHKRREALLSGKLENLDEAVRRHAVAAAELDAVYALQDAFESTFAQDDDEDVTETSQTMKPVDIDLAASGVRGRTRNFSISGEATSTNHLGSGVTSSVPLPAAERAYQALMTTLTAQKVVSRREGEELEDLVGGYGLAHALDVVVALPANKHDLKDIGLLEAELLGLGPGPERFRQALVAGISSSKTHFDLDLGASNPMRVSGSKNHATSHDHSLNTSAESSLQDIDEFEMKLDVNSTKSKEKANSLSPSSSASATDESHEFSSHTGNSRRSSSATNGGADFHSGQKNNSAAKTPLSRSNNIPFSLTESLAPPRNDGSITKTYTYLSNEESDLTSGGASVPLSSANVPTGGIAHTPNAAGLGKSQQPHSFIIDKEKTTSRSRSTRPDMISNTHRRSKSHSTENALTVLNVERENTANTMRLSKSGVFEGEGTSTLLERRQQKNPKERGILLGEFAEKSQHLVPDPTNPSNSPIYSLALRSKSNSNLISPTKTSDSDGLHPHARTYTSPYKRLMPRRDADDDDKSVISTLSAKVYESYSSVGNATRGGKTSGALEQEIRQGMRGTGTGLKYRQAKALAEGQYPGAAGLTLRSKENMDEIGVKTGSDLGFTSSRALRALTIQKAQEIVDGKVSLMGSTKRIGSANVSVGIMDTSNSVSIAGVSARQKLNSSSSITSRATNSAGLQKRALRLAHSGVDKGKAEEMLSMSQIMRCELSSGSEFSPLEREIALLRRNVVNNASASMTGNSSNPSIQNLNGGIEKDSCNEGILAANPPNNGLLFNSVALPGTSSNYEESTAFPEQNSSVVPAPITQDDFKIPHGGTLKKLKVLL